MSVVAQYRAADRGKGLTGIMDVAEYVSFDASGLSALIRRGDVSRREVLAAALQAVATVNETVNAIVEAYDDVLEFSDDPLQGTPFAGVPLAVKDLGWVERGRRCEAGSRLLAGWVAESEREVVKRIKGAGLIPVARAAAAEFGEVVTVETALYGQCRNPWNVAYSTGGSSGGSAAAVASRMVPLAHGNDGGGSIRVPAACCGLVGLKPSRDRVVKEPSSYFLGDITADFVLTRSVRDARKLFAALDSRRDLGGCHATKSIGERLRIAVTTKNLWGRGEEQEVVEATLRTAKTCETLGYDVEEYELRLGDVEEYLSATIDIWAAMAARDLDAAAAKTGRAVGAETVEGYTYALYEHGKGLAAARVVDALALYRVVAAEVLRQMEPYDALLLPTLPRLPPLLGAYTPLKCVDVSWYLEESELGTFESGTSLFNCTGQPAISVPMEWSVSGLPIGMQFVGRWGDDELLLALAAELEEVSGWLSRRPAVSAGRRAP